MGCEVVLIAVCSVFLHVMGRVFVHMLCLVSGVCAAVSLPVCASALGTCVLWWIVMSVECVVGLLFELAWLLCFCVISVPRSVSGFCALCCRVFRVQSESVPGNVLCVLLVLWTSMSALG